MTIDTPFPARRLTASMPLTRDPIVNTPLTRVSPDPATGAERFWISSFNGCLGSTAVLLDEYGNHRILRTNNWRVAGLYSAAPSPRDPDALWLTCQSKSVIKVSLSSLTYESFPASAYPALVFQGMAFDPDTAKAAYGFYAPPTQRITVFDTQNRKTTYDGPSPSKGLYMRASFPNGDGTYSLLYNLPGVHLVVWDPKSDTFTDLTLNPAISYKQSHHFYHPVVQNDAGDRYIHNAGWFRPSLRQIVDSGPLFEPGVSIVARHEGKFLACRAAEQSLAVGFIDPASGKLAPTCAIPDARMLNINLTASGKIICVNTYGEFFRFDAATGALESSRRLATDSHQSVDCLIRSTKTRILGTTFINQRFFEVDMKTGKGFEQGRCAPGGGEALFAKRIKGIVYMGAYTGGELMAYDPALPARFPENPRVVADPPGGMRPVAVTHDERILIYSCSNEYARLGSVLTRYDTHTGLASYAVNPLPDLQIRSLVLDAKKRLLYAGSATYADCHSAPPTQSTCCIAVFNADTLALIKRIDLPPGHPEVSVHGYQTRKSLFCTTSTPAGPLTWFALDRSTLSLPQSFPQSLKPFAFYRPLATRIPGLYVIKNAQKMEVWDVRLPELAPVRLLHESDDNLCHIDVDGDAVLYTYPTQVNAIHGFLKGLK